MSIASSMNSIYPTNFHNFNPHHLNNFLTDMNVRNFKNADLRFPQNFYDLYNPKLPNNLDNFNFQKLGFPPQLNNANKNDEFNSPFISESFNIGLSLIPPIRRSESISKKPVTIVSSNTSKQNTKFKSDESDLYLFKEKPRQLFWTKRNQGLRPSIINKRGKIVKSSANFEFPANIKALGPNIDNEALIQNLASILHSSTSTFKPIYGQIDMKKVPNSTNIWAYFDIDQPFFEPLEIKEEDIKRQEYVVQNIRKKLEKLINRLDNLTSQASLLSDNR